MVNNTLKNVPRWGGLELQQKRDNIKNEYAISHNIPLVRIPYWEQENINNRFNIK